MPRRVRFIRGVDCPTCGATPSHQKWKPRKVTDLDDVAIISECNPVDAVHCHRCDLVFRVSHYEHDDTYITNWDEIETIPRYCPWCGEDLQQNNH